MRHLLTIITMLIPVTGIQAYCCQGGHHSWCGSRPVVAYAAPVVYVVPYWAPVIYADPVWINPAVVPATRAAVRENTIPPRKAPAAAEKSPPRIVNPRIPDDEIEPKKVLPAPKLVAPKKVDVPKAKENEKSVSVDEFLIPAERKRSETPGEVKVGIFNHSEREMELVINGETVKLPADQYVTLRMPRTFTWAVKGKEPKEVRVPADSDGLEIVFRR